MKPHATPSSEYQPPAHVGVLQLLSLLGFVAGLFWIVTSKMETEQLAFGLGSVIGSMYLWIFSAVAGNAARAAWQTARTAYELRPVIEEMKSQLEQREKREAKARAEQEAEIRRVLTAQHLAQEANEQPDAGPS
jgi:hypothetical protein